MYGLLNVDIFIWLGEGGRGWGGGHEISRQEKEARGGWVRRQSMRDLDKRRMRGVGG